MKSIHLIFIALLLLLLSSCAENPFTGKKTLALVSNDALFPQAFAEYDKFLDENQVVTGTTQAEMVKTVGEKIANAAQRYLNAKGNPGYLKDYKWEYHLVNSKEVNAWCMPGGKIVVYTGILPITQDEAGLAVVLGHEVSHALLNHGQQRMSQNELIQGIGVLGQSALGDSDYSNSIMKAYGGATQLGIALPFSRKNETEADDLGLQLMAIAGYDPKLLSIYGKE